MPRSSGVIAAVKVTQRLINLCGYPFFAIGLITGVFITWFMAGVAAGASAVEIASKGESS